MITNRARKAGVSLGGQVALSTRTDLRESRMDLRGVMGEELRLGRLDPARRRVDYLTGCR
jgi:hypothetical protein